MYGTKEKLRIYNEINNKEHAEADLLLLSGFYADKNKINTYQRNPQRYHGDILFKLLDHKTKEEIRAHRREFLNKKEKENENLPENNADSGKEGGKGPEDGNPENTGAKESDGNPSNGAIVDDLKEVNNELVEEIKDLKEENEILQEENDDLQSQVEDEQQAHEETKQELEDEKKSQVPKKSRKKKNTPT